MAEDIVELGLEAIGPIVKHHDTAWQTVKSKAKGGIRSFPEDSQRREEGDDEQSQYQYEDTSRRDYGKSDRHRSQYRNENRRQDDYDIYRDDNEQSDRYPTYRSNGSQFSQRGTGPERPRTRRRASSLDRSSFQQSRSRQRRDSGKAARGDSKGEADGANMSRGIDRKDALTAGLVGIAAIYLTSGLYKDYKGKKARLAKDPGWRKDRSRSVEGRNGRRSESGLASPRE